MSDRRTAELIAASLLSTSPKGPAELVECIETALGFARSLTPNGQTHAPKESRKTEPPVQCPTCKEMVRARGTHRKTCAAKAAKKARTETKLVACPKCGKKLHVMGYRTHVKHCKGKP